MTTTLHQETVKKMKADEAALRDTWGTPQRLFDKMNAEVLARKQAIAHAAGQPPPTAGFTVDICAEAWNAKCPLWWGPGSATGITDTLTQGNLAGHDWWGNIPFGQISKWLQWVHRWYSLDARQANMLAGIGYMVLPATKTEQEEWQTMVEPFRDKPWVWQQTGFSLMTEFITTETEKAKYGRTKYVPPAGIKPSSPQFGTVILKWAPL